MTRLMMALWASALMALAVTGSAHAQERPTYDPSVQFYQLQHAGVARSFGLYVPSTYRPGQPAPLIIALHGRFSSAQAMHAQTGLTAVAEARGAIIAYAEAVEFWNDGGHQILNRPGEPADDKGFIAAATDIIAANFSLDSARTYLVGYDAGGGLVYTLLCQGGNYAGAAIVGGLMWDYQRDQCANARVTPLLIVHGRRDEYAPIRGGDVRGIEVRRLGVADTLAVWRGANGCSAPDVRGTEDSAIYRSCTSAAMLAYVGVAGGNRDWFHTGDGYELNRQGVDATALVDSFLFSPDNFRLPQAQSRGRSRSWIVYAPPEYDPTQPSPVVVLLHGRPSNGGGMAAMTGMNEVARRNNFIVVYPDGIDNEWNAQFDLSARDISLGGRRSTLPQDDVGFLKTLMADLAVDFNVDRRRLYLGGFSNGGFMTYRMACSAADTFAAFAAVGGNLYLELSEHCRRSPPTALLMMNGTADPSVPYEGVTVTNPQGGDPIRISFTMQEAVAAFIRRNGCNLSGRSTTFAEGGGSPGTHVVRFEPSGCPAGADIMFYIVNGGGHTWPGRTRIPAELGPTNMDMDAGEVIWDFFSAHSLAAR